ncbi:acid phosphatase/Vanadium-dependent haloperoxidase [Decorospora gaudefroyi]|uniref:Acid phosphatase/Vanadium-dependent haloperoxidase n=1 Tax=Decorospora gaudefroyi TaxID=184978 RepID=A0A6A5KMY2_9PLEO|nr:acid phosphatase/Vanadium-dependent haloperoxidase [Decorospora gaudefroyi]
MRTFTRPGMPSLRLVTSYIFDWIVLVGIVAVSGSWHFVEPFKRPFSPVDLTISFPFQTSEIIPIWLLGVCAFGAPAVIIMVVCLIFVPGPTAERGTPKALIWRRKLWEWNTGSMGLGLSLAIALLITQGMKNLFGKPRPDLLSRCQPDLSRIQEFAVNPVGAVFDPAWVLVTPGICTNTDMSMLNDGFRSFPSGHASFSWAGLLYLTLFLASKFSVAIPFLPHRPFTTNPAYTSATTPSNLKKASSLPYHKQDSTLSSSTSYNEPVIPIRYQNAAPPVYTLVLVLIPVCSAIYISSTRFTDFRHFPFDILFGTLIGVLCAYFSFRFYHLPISRGAGWAWGPRSYERAWGIGVGRGSYVGTEGWTKAGKSETAAVSRNTGRAEEGSENGVLDKNETPRAGHTPTSNRSRSDVTQDV